MEYSCNEILHSNTKKKKTDTQSEKDETHRHYDEAKKPDTKD